MEKTLYDLYKFYVDVKKEYNKTKDEDIKKNLKLFREKFGEFTDKIFNNDKFNIKEKGRWLKADGRHIAEYMWNRYKIYDEYNLVIYFNVSKNKDIFLGIGLVDDKIDEFEKKYSEKIYNYLDEQCMNIKCDGFKKDKKEPRKFLVKDIEKFESQDYSCLIEELIKVYHKTIEHCYEKKCNSSVEENIGDNKMKHPLI
jgi:hypothetical protein